MMYQKKPIFESTPKNEHEDNNSNLSENESQTSEQSKKEKLPNPAPPPPPEPRKSSTELPKTTVSEPDKQTKSTIKNDIKDNHHKSLTPSPVSGIINHEESTNHNIKPTPPKIKTPEQNVNNTDKQS